MPSDVVGEVLQHAKFGFLAYPVDLLGKSGVFAAYAAHGVVPIVLSEKKGTFEDLEPGRHFLHGLTLEENVGADTLASIQTELFRWYASHSLDIQTEFLYRCIKEHQNNYLPAFA
jgi:hypothetical protein